jgi:nitrogen fixation NifU-like protein
MAGPNNNASPENAADFADRASASSARIWGEAELTGSCGDGIRMRVALQDEILVEIAAHTKGCTYTDASASAVIRLAKGRSLDEVLHLTPEEVCAVVGDVPDDHFHCARLALNTLGEAVIAAFGAGNSCHANTE